MTTFWDWVVGFLAILAVLCVVALVGLAGHAIYQGYERGEQKREAQNDTKIAKERLLQRAIERSAER